MFIVDRGYGGSVLLAAGLILGLAFAGHRQFGTPFGCGAESGWVSGSDRARSPRSPYGVLQSSRRGGTSFCEAEDAAGPIGSLQEAIEGAVRRRKWRGRRVLAEVCS